jgi:hypothetical protein
MAEKQQQIRISIPTDIDALGRAVLGRMIIDFIQDRTSKGKDISGANFARYSQSYKESADFETAGKSGLVNLQLTGDTLASIEVLSHAPGSVTLGFEAGTQENDKAAWVSDNVGGPSRSFLGINAKDLQKVVAQYRELNPQVENEISNQARSIFNRLLGNG